MENTEKNNVENTSSKESKSENRWYYDLLKYPILTLCIVLGMVCLAKFAGIEFDKITKISTSGVEFANEKSEQAILSLNTDISAINTKLGNLEGHTGLDLNTAPTTSKAPGTGGGAGYAEKLNTEAVANRLNTTEVVSNAIAGMSFVDADRNTKLNGETGYVWLGAYYNGWIGGCHLRSESNTGTVLSSIAPLDIASSRYLIDKNLKLRNNPLDGNTETRDSSLIGIVPQSTPVTLLSVEKGEDNQYWAKIKVQK